MGAILIQCYDYYCHVLKEGGNINIKNPLSYRLVI